MPCRFFNLRQLIFLVDDERVNLICVYSHVHHFAVSGPRTVVRLLHCLHTSLCFTREPVVTKFEYVFCKCSEGSKTEISSLQMYSKPPYSGGVATSFAQLELNSLSRPAPSGWTVSVSEPPSLGFPLIFVV